MAGNKFMLTTVALGAAYLLRNKHSRQKLKDQFRNFVINSSRG